MALTVRKLRWLGLSVEDPEAAVTFFRETLGMRLLFHDSESTELETQEGERIQLFGPSSRFFERARRPFPLFEIEDAPAARDELSALGIEVGPLEADAEWDWFDVVGPEGFVFELGSRR